MPNALAIGVSYELFWHLSPTKLKAFEEAYMIKRKMRDEEMWYMGQYVASALNATVCNAEFWRGKNGKAEKYVEKPFMSNVNTNKGKLTEEEKQKAVDLFFAKENARRVNWRRNHKDSTGS